MKNKINVFDSKAANELTLENLIRLYKTLGISRIIYKKLSPNDNSKNQPYMAGHLTDLGFLPTGEIIESKSTSKKTKDIKRQIKYTTQLNLSWLSAEGQLYPATHSKLIYYPQYPEVRLSGFLQGCDFDSGGWMDPYKKGRSEGRVLFFGIKNTGEIISWLSTPESRIAKEIKDYPSIQLSGIFNELELLASKRKGTAKEVLISELRRIHELQWIEGKKLSGDGIAKPYTARNGGGYTLEAELGVIPNGIAEPDFMGWEVKQFGVKKCHLINSKPLTLMTPEPDGGFYVEQGAEAFIRKYGYSSGKIADRLDFTGSHYVNKVCEKSNLKLVLMGYNKLANEITDASGCIALIDSKDEIASSWSFSKVMGHWKRKHARSSYIPSVSIKRPDKTICYSYCNNIRLFEGTTFTKLLQAFSHQHVYYDPGIKLENASSKPALKRRSQFRIKSRLLDNLYDSCENVDVME